MTLAPIADAKVDASAPGSNYGTGALRVDGSPVVRSYLKFDTSALSGSLQNATLRIWATSSQGAGFDVYAVSDSSWTETGLTAANQPSGSISGSKLGSSGSVSAGTWTSVDVTPLLGAPGIYSVMLQTSNSQALALASREEAAHAPQLVLSFGTASTTVPDAPSNVHATAGDGQATVSWAAPPANGSPISGYTISGAPGGSASATGGATSATITGLANGTSYTFTVTATNGVGPGPASAPSTPVTPTAVTTVANLRRAPYLTDVSPTTAIVNLATDSSAPMPTVSWGPASGDCTAPPSSVPAVWVTSFAGSRSGTTDYQFKAPLAGLEPDTSYCYRVQQNGTDLVGAAITFTSAPALGSTTPFSFAVIGDWGSGSADEANIFTQIALGQPRFLMTVGDNVYPGGTQSEYGDLNGGNAFAPMFLPKLGSGTPIFPAMGNHGFTASQPYLDNFPQDATAASSGGTYSPQSYCCAAGTSMTNTYASAWYAFTWGTARIYVLDGAWADANGDYRGDFTDHWNGPVAGCTPCGQELTWLQGDLAANASVPLKFAFFHYPLHADGGHPSDAYLGGPNGLEGLLAQSGVDIVFNGHAHIYERNLPQIAGTAMVSYVTGGGGAALASVSSCSGFDAYAIGANSRCNAPLPTSSSQAFHYLKVSVDGTQVTVSPIDETGRSFDVQTYAFGPAAVDTTPPTAPTSLTATSVGSARIDLSWAAATDDVGVVGYDISRGGSIVASVSGGALAYTDTMVAPSSTYSYTVRARDLAGNSSPDSAPASATTQAGASSLTLTPIADAFVDRSKPTSNFGSLTALRVDGSPVVRSYLRFNVQVGAATIIKATLRIYANSASTTGLGARGMTGAWAENTITDNNAPAMGGSNVGTSTKAVAGSWLSLDVTALVKVSGLVDIGVVTAGSTAISLASRESANAPQLVLQVGP